MNLYDLLRGVHIIAVMAWVAGLLILPRLFVYHLRTEPASSAEEVFRSAETRTINIILNPAMGLAWILGLSLIWFDGSQRLGWDFLWQPWMIVKLAGIVFVTWWHHFIVRAGRRFAAGERLRSEKFWRATNELPFLAAILMVLAVTLEFSF
ncbi:MAG: CopD family protein [Caulobacteraceae bacterium]|nr:CopD family protein [Caulobacteraceae bacterium]